MTTLFATVILLSTTFFSTIICTPHYCCPDNRLLSKEGCGNGTKIILKSLCGDQKIFIDAPESESDTLIINKEDGLVLNDDIFPKDQFCIGDMMIEGVKQTVALVCFGENDEHHETTKRLVIVICCFISILFLLATLIVYIILPQLRDLQGKCLIFSIFSLFMAFLFLASIQLIRAISQVGCITMACLLYFWFLCVFFWLNVVSFNVWRKVVIPKWSPNKQKLFYIYNAYGWGMPTLLLIILLLCHHLPGGHLKPKFGESSCWFSGKAEVWLYFYGPISILLILNAIMFFSLAWTLWRNVTYKEQKHRSQKFKFLLYLKLFFIMGLCWMFEPLSELIRSWAWIVTDFVNALQGVLIFLLLVAFRKRVRRDLARKGMFCGVLPQTWATIRDEECEELDEDLEEASSININTNP